MILYPIIDLLKRIVVDLPDYVKPSGGGSISKTVYTQVEDWTTTANGGNMLDFSNTYFDNSFLGVTIITVTNNSVVNHYANCGFRINMNGKSVSVLVRDAAEARANGTSTTDFFISVGSLITVYKIPQEDL